MHKLKLLAMLDSYVKPQIFFRCAQGRRLANCGNKRIFFRLAVVTKHKQGSQEQVSKKRLQKRFQE